MRYLFTQVCLHAQFVGLPSIRAGEQGKEASRRAAFIWLAAKVVQTGRLPLIIHDRKAAGLRQTLRSSFHSARQN